LIFRRAINSREGMMQLWEQRDILIVVLMRLAPDRYGGAHADSGRGRPRVTPVLESLAGEFMARHLDRNVCIADLAAYCGLSRSHFSRAFKQMTGVPPHRFQLQLRIEKAKALLCTPGRRMADIAMLCGFTDQSHFNRRFKQLVGLTPLEWRMRDSPVARQGQPRG
jgi:AraC family transcriptional regulator